MLLKSGKRIICDEEFVRGNSVITCQDPFESGFAGWKIAKKFNLLLHLHIHTDFLSPYSKILFLNKIRLMLAKFLLPKADGIRVVSSVIENSVKKEFPNLKADISVLPIFVDMEAIVNTIATRSQISEHTLFKRNILKNSRLPKEKRFDVALKAFKEVSKKDDTVGLVIWVSGPEYNNIKNIIKDLKLKTKISFKGNWENIYIATHFYKLSDIFLLTSEYQGYGMTLIEAGASGCPIVTTNVGIAKTNLFKEVNSFVCPVGDVDCLSKCLIELLSNESKRDL